MNVLKRFFENFSPHFYVFNNLYFSGTFSYMFFSSAMFLSETGISTRTTDDTATSSQ